EARAGPHIGWIADLGAVWPFIYTPGSAARSLYAAAPRLASRVERFAVVGAYRNARPAPVGVTRDETVVVDVEVRLERAALVSVRVFVEAGVGLRGLD